MDWMAHLLQRCGIGALYNPPKWCCAIFLDKEGAILDGKSFERRIQNLLRFHRKTVRKAFSDTFHPLLGQLRGLAKLKGKKAHKVWSEHWHKEEDAIIKWCRKLRLEGVHAGIFHSGEWFAATKLDAGTKELYSLCFGLSKAEGKKPMEESTDSETASIVTGEEEDVGLKDPAIEDESSQLSMISDAPTEDDPEAWPKRKTARVQKQEHDLLHVGTCYYIPEGGAGTPAPLGMTTLRRNGPRLALPLTYKVEAVLTPLEMALTVQNFANMHLRFTGKGARKHSFCRVMRELSHVKLLTYLEEGERDVVEVGSDFLRTYENFPTIWHTMPILDPADAARRKKVERAAAARGWDLEALPICQHKIEECLCLEDIRPTTFVMVDVIYYLSISTILDLVHDTNRRILTLQHEFPAADAQKWEDYRYERNGDGEVTCWINGNNNNLPFVHSACDWLLPRQYVHWDGRCLAITELFRIPELDYVALEIKAFPGFDPKRDARLKTRFWDREHYGVCDDPRFVTAVGHVFSNPDYQEAILETNTAGYWIAAVSRWLKDTPQSGLPMSRVYSAGADFLISVAGGSQMGRFQSDGHRALMRYVVPKTVLAEAKRLAAGRARDAKVWAELVNTVRRGLLTLKRTPEDVAKLVVPISVLAFACVEEDSRALKHLQVRDTELREYNSNLKFDFSTPPPASLFARLWNKLKSPTALAIYGALLTGVLGYYVIQRGLQHKRDKAPGAPAMLSSYRDRSGRPRGPDYVYQDLVPGPSRSDSWFWRASEDQSRTSDPTWYRVDPATTLKVQNVPLAPRSALHSVYVPDSVTRGDGRAPVPFTAAGRVDPNHPEPFDFESWKRWHGVAHEAVDYRHRGGIWGPTPYRPGGASPPSPRPVVHVIGPSRPPFVVRTPPSDEEGIRLWGRPRMSPDPTPPGPRPGPGRARDMASVFGLIHGQPLWRAALGGVVIGPFVEECFRRAPLLLPSFIGVPLSVLCSAAIPFVEYGAVVNEITSALAEKLELVGTLPVELQKRVLQQALCLYTGPLLIHGACSLLPFKWALLLHMLWNLHVLLKEMGGAVNATSQDLVRDIPGYVVPRIRVLFGRLMNSRFVKRAAPVVGAASVGGLVMWLLWWTLRTRPVLTGSRPAMLAEYGAATVPAYCFTRTQLIPALPEFPMYDGPFLQEGKHAYMKISPSAPECQERTGGWLMGIGLMHYPPTVMQQCIDNLAAATASRALCPTPPVMVDEYESMSDYASHEIPHQLGIMTVSPGDSMDADALAGVLDEAVRTNRQALTWPQIKEMSVEEYAADFEPGRREQLFAAFRSFATAFLTLKDSEVDGMVKIDEKLTGVQLASWLTWLYLTGQIVWSTYEAGSGELHCTIPNILMEPSKNPRLISANGSCRWHLATGVWIKPMEHKFLYRTRQLLAKADGNLETLSQLVYLELLAGRNAFITKGLNPNDKGLLRNAIHGAINRATGEEVAVITMDGKSYDAHHKAHFRVWCCAVLKAMGVAPDIVRLILEEMREFTVRNVKGFYAKGPGIMGSGKTYTAIFHCIINALTALYAFARAMGEIPEPPFQYAEDVGVPAGVNKLDEELLRAHVSFDYVWKRWLKGVYTFTPRTRQDTHTDRATTVDGDDNEIHTTKSNMERIRGSDVFSKVLTWLGLTMKINFFSDPLFADYCSGFHWPALAGPAGMKVECNIHGPIIGRALTKMGWAIDKYPEHLRLRWLGTVYHSLVADYRHVPILRAVVARTYMDADVTRAVRIRGHEKHKIHVSCAGEATYETWRFMQGRYGLSREEVELFEKEIYRLKSLPVLIAHPVIDIIMRRDYPEIAAL